MIISKKWKQPCKVAEHFLMAVSGKRGVKSTFFLNLCFCQKLAQYPNFFLLKVLPTERPYDY